MHALVPSSMWFERRAVLDLDQECFCRFPDDPAAKQTPTSPFRIFLDSTEATAHEETLCVWFKTIPRCGEKSEDFEDLPETRPSPLRPSDQATSRGGRPWIRNGRRRHHRAQE